MRISKAWLWLALSCGLWGCSLFLSPRALGFQVLEIPTAQGQGRDGSEITTLAIPRGHSVNISFIDSGHFVQSIWLDDPAHVVFNTDSPLCDQGFQGQGQCGSASVIRIRQLAQAIDFPVNASNEFYQPGGVRSTVMTIVATDAQNQRYLYQFILQLVPQSTANHTAVRIVPHSTQPPRTVPNIVRRQVQTRLAEIRRGIQLAQQQQLLDTTSDQWPKLQQFLQLASAGDRSLNEAINQSGVSQELLNRLAAIGSQ